MSNITKESWLSALGGEKEDTVGDVSENLVSLRANYEDVVLLANGAYVEEYDLAKIRKVSEALNRAVEVLRKTKERLQEILK